MGSHSSLETDPRWKLAERLVSTPGLAKSPRLSSLLLYVVRQTLDGREAELNEQFIGERLFGRPIGYDPRDDNIVRAHASRLRQKLEAYYLAEGNDEPLRVTIPRGSYVPLFERAELPARAASLDTPGIADVQREKQVAATDSQDSSDSRGQFYSQSHSHSPTSPELQRAADAQMPSHSQRAAANVRLLWAATGAFAALLLFALSHLALGRWGPTHATPQDPTDRLWAAIFSKARPSLIVPADSGLIILKSLTGHTVSATDYASGRYLSTVTCQAPCDRQMLETLAGHRYTSLADLQFAVDLSHLPAAVANHPEIRYARDLQLDDLKKDNVVLIGSLESDPWLQFLQSQMNFVLHDDRTDGPLQVENKRPMPGEPSSYPYDRGDRSHQGYALVAFLPNLGEDGDVLVVQGFSLADTQAAADFVTNHRDFNSALGPIVAKRHGLPHLEILLRTVDVNGFGSHSSIVASRVY